MKVELRPEQQAWLEAQVSAGMFASEQDAFDAMFPAEDDAWAQPYIDEALADVKAGHTDAWDVEELRAKLHEAHPELKS